MTLGFSKDKQLGKRVKPDKPVIPVKAKKRKPLKKVSKKQAKELKGRSKLKAQLVMESEGKCMTCNKKPRNGIGLSLSHIVPLSRGGQTCRENCLAECDNCHRTFEKHPEKRPMWQQVRAGIAP